MVRTLPLLSLCAALAALPAVHAHAQDLLSGDEIKAFIGGKDVFLSTPYGLEFPLTYRSNGQVTGDASGFRLASIFAPRETGKWWVEGDRLCQQWPSWYDGKRLCFTVSRTAPDAIMWVREDGLKGTARIRG